MKFEPRCHICTFARRDELHNDHLNNKLSLVEIGYKYFPGREIKYESRALSKHFKKHFNADKDVAAISVAQATPALRQSVYGTPMLVTEERVYNEYVRKRLSATAALEEALRNLMEKANLIEDEWISIHQASKCSVCGRDDNKETLGKMLAIFKELREMHSALMKVRNPIEIFKKFFEQTFVIFVDKIMELYMETLREKGKMISEAINQYLRSEISAALLSRRVAELENMGTGELERQVKEQFKKILQNVRKEMDVAL